MKNMNWIFEAEENVKFAKDGKCGMEVEGLIRLSRGCWSRYQTCRSRLVFVADDVNLGVCVQWMKLVYDWNCFLNVKSSLYNVIHIIKRKLIHNIFWPRFLQNCSYPIQAMRDASRLMDAEERGKEVWLVLTTNQMKVKVKWERNLKRQVLRLTNHNFYNLESKRIVQTNSVHLWISNENEWISHNYKSHL